MSPPVHPVDRRVDAAPFSSDDSAQARCAHATRCSAPSGGGAPRDGSTGPVSEAEAEPSGGALELVWKDGTRTEHTNSASPGHKD